MDKHRPHLSQNRNSSLLQIGEIIYTVFLEAFIIFCFFSYFEFLVLFRVALFTRTKYKGVRIPFHLHPNYTPNAEFSYVKQWSTIFLKAREATVCWASSLLPSRTASPKPQGFTQTPGRPPKS